MKIHDIEVLVQRWLGAGKISKEQARYIIADTRDYVSDQSGGRFISAIMYMGALALSLGALLFIASNWRYMGDGFKTIVSLLLPIVPISIAYWKLIVQKTDTVIGKATHILSLFLVGGAIALLGQMYHLQSDIQSFLWTWCLLTAPLLLVFKRVENVVFTTLLLGTALFFSLLDFFDSRDFEEGAIVILLTIAVLLYAYLMYHLGSALRQHTSWEHSGRFLRIEGGAVAATMLFVMTTEWYAQMVVGNDYYTSGNLITWQSLSLVLNLVFIGFLVFALLRATRHEEYQFAFSIVRLFGLYLLVKYFTLFYSMLDTGLFFIIGGVIFILGGGFLEKKKAVFVQYMKHEHRSLTRNSVQHHD